MTFRWLYVFDIDLFTVKKHVSTTGDIDFEIVLKVKRNIPKNKYFRNRHCFWAQ